MSPICSYFEGKSVHEYGIVPLPPRNMPRETLFNAWVTNRCARRGATYFVPLNADHNPILGHSGVTDDPVQYRDQP